MKEVMVAALAAIFGAATAIFFTTGERILDDKAKRDMANLAASDASFQEIVADKIIDAGVLLGQLKNDEDFRGAKGLDGSSPAPEVIAEILRSDREFIRSLITKSKWPHAINCGNQWTTLLVQHAVPNPTDNESLAWYEQVYTPSRRFVQFNADQTFHDSGGDNEATILGCVGKSISQLREEGRAFSFFVDQ